MLRAIQSWDQGHERCAASTEETAAICAACFCATLLPSKRDRIGRCSPRWTMATLLLMRDLGKGHALVFANPLTRAWSDFPTQRIFLPLMKEWFTRLTRFNPDQDAAREIAPGLNEPRAIGTYESGGALEVVAPDPSEMDVTVADEAFARRALGLPGENAPVPVGENLRLPKFRERQNEIWPWIALALLALLIFDTVLSDQRSKSRERVIQ